MTDPDTVSTAPEAGELEPATPDGPNGPEPVGRRIDGEALWAGLKDGAVVLFALFFGLVYLGYRSIDRSEVAGPAAGGGPIEVTLNEFVINGNLRAPVGEIVLHIVNTGTVNHDVVIPQLGERTPELAPGEEATLVLGGVSARSYEVFCSIPGHRESGMESVLEVSLG